MKKSHSTQFDKFDRTMRELVKVPHDELKAKLDAEKKAKTKRSKQKGDKKNDDRN